MATDETRAQWRAAAKRYYAKHGPAIALWKTIQHEAKKRGITLPKLTAGELSAHTPMDLVQLYRLPAALITDRAYRNYRAALKRREEPKKCEFCGKPLNGDPIHTKECAAYYEEKRKNEPREIN